MEAMLCISHTLSHCGEHVELPTLEEFMTPWLSLLQNHPSARSIWKEKMLSLIHISEPTRRS
eukprot:5682423-Prymnesium_polylepis.1